MSDTRYHGLILAGGRGTRFWPLSRRRTPKQVLTVTGDRSLIQATVDRLRPLIPPSRIWVLTNDFVRDEIVRQLPEVPPEQILAEPAQKNTAPAIGLAAHMLASIDPDAIMGVFPSDHVISDPETYLSLLRPAFAAAAEGRIAVLGVQPRWAETGYGYIEFPAGVPAGEVAPVRSFREKPKAEIAREYVDSGRFYWNAGMFFWRAQVILDNLRQHLPVTAKLIDSLPGFQNEDFASAVAETFPKTENISIDFAVLEKATGIVGVPCTDFGWNDVGSWDAVHDLLPQDEHRNASRAAELLVESASGNLVEANGKLVALLGVDNLIVVDTPDALLIADRSRAQQVGDLVKRLEALKRDPLL